MDVKTGLFYLFSAVLLFAAFRVITSRNPVYAALYLVLAFFQASAIWLLLRAEFLAIALVLVYVGAVMVLFLFVVMMLDINVEDLREGFWKHFPLAAAVGALIALEMAGVLIGGFRLTAPRDAVGRLRARHLEHARTRQAALFAIPLSAGDRGGDPAGGDRRRHRADPARPQGQQVHQCRPTRSASRRATGCASCRCPSRMAAPPVPEPAPGAAAAETKA